MASEIGYAGPLRLLAFDHRDLVKKMARERAREGKRLIYEGFLRGASGEGAGLLVDEELGAEIAREALAADYVVAMPVERSGSDAFEFEYARSIRQLRNAGLDPDVWKVEGLDKEDDCRRIVKEVHAGGRDHVPAVVLGAGADAATVERWLRLAARVPGYAGFAVGRTLWWDELQGWLECDLAWNEATEQIGANYRRMLDAYGCAG